MLKATHSQSGEDILILSPHWKAKLQALRQLDRQDLLVCPGCYQPVRVKAGHVKRWHFAHKHLANCPFERQSPQLLEARAVLYEYLAAQLGEASVVLEKMIPGLPRPLDCFVSLPAGEPGQPARSAAYWVFDARMPPDERERLEKVLSGLGGATVWVFVASLLRTEPDQVTQVHLTTTEREFKRRTDSDCANPLESFLVGETLHYLDASTNMLLTYRNLNLFHPPQLFAGRRLSDPLSEVGVDPQYGDFLHPGEAQRVAHYRQTRQRREEKMQTTLPQLGVRFGNASSASRKDIHPSLSPVKKASPPGEDFYHAPFARVGTCLHCGKQTDDWVRFDGRTGTCICRDCADK